MRYSLLGQTRFALSGLLLVGLVTACSSAPAPQSPTDAVTGQRSEDGAWSPFQIDRAEIEARGGNDHSAMDLIRRLRPAWLRARGQKSFTDDGAQFPVVYIDDIRHGGLPTLHRIPSAEILELRFINTADATTRWGTGHPSGVINVLTGRWN